MKDLSHDIFDIVYIPKLTIQMNAHAVINKVFRSKLYLSYRLMVYYIFYTLKTPGSA